MEFFLGAFEKEWQARRAALLHERSLGRKRTIEEEERRRRGGAVASELPTLSAPDWGKWHDASRRRPRGQSWTGEPSMRSRFERLANGSQPVVVKLASFGSGSRVGAMISYVSRNGAVSVENERGEQLAGRDNLSAVRGKWDHLMRNRAESRDFGTFTVTVKDADDRLDDQLLEARQILGTALGDRRFAFAVSPQSGTNGFSIYGVAVLRDENGERLSGDAKASEMVQVRLDADTKTHGRGVEFRFVGYGNGTDYGSARVRDLVARSVGVRDEGGRVISDSRQAANLVQLEWRHHLHSRKSRDVMHLVLSARADTDVNRFRAAAGDFLASQFAGHRYIFSLHEPANDPKSEEAGGKRPHVHVHAIIAMRSDFGERVATSIASFRQWRVAMAEAARTNGIDMEMTDRRDRASPPAYGRNQVRPKARLGRTEHEGTSVAAQIRYDNQRSDRRSFGETPSSQRYTDLARMEWRKIADGGRGSNGNAFAEAQADRLEIRGQNSEDASIRVGQQVNSPSEIKTLLAKLENVVLGDATMQQMSRIEFEAYEKRVGAALDHATDVIPASQSQALREIFVSARAHVDARRELMEITEQSQRGDQRQQPQIADRQAAEDRLHDDVAPSGRQAVNAARRIMLRVDYYRKAIDRPSERDFEVNRSLLKEKLSFELAQAGELGAAGNALIREISRKDTELRAAIEAAEHDHHRPVDKVKDDGSVDLLSAPSSLEPTRHAPEKNAHERHGIDERDTRGANRHANKNDAIPRHGETAGRAEPFPKDAAQADGSKREAQHRVRRHDDDQER